jgi:hypothetical protein
MAVGAIAARRQNFATISWCSHIKPIRYVREKWTEFVAYRVAYLLLPLQHVGHREIAGELHMAVEHNRLAQDGGDVDRILVAKPCNNTAS